MAAVLQKGIHVLRGAHATAYGQRDENLLRGSADHIHHGLTVGAGGGDIKEGQLIGPLTIVFGGELNRISCIAQILKMHALDHSPRVDIKTWDDSDCQ